MEKVSREEIIGRREEKRVLQRIFDSRTSEFLAIYGRRRVGKTYLIKQFFYSKDCYFFQITGVKKAPLKEQLYEFTRQVEKSFYPPGTTLKEPTGWMRALEMLTNAVSQKTDKRIILFFDEIPWLATKRARFLQALDYYWNTVWVENTNLRLIVCGSAASWVIQNIVNNKGGLHNRITAQIRLEPFNLKGTSEFLKYRGLSLNSKQILSLYMVMGGIPHYLKQIEKGLSASQNIDALCFTKNGLLFKEFNNLFSSLFSKPEPYIDIIRRIGEQRHGVERTKLIVQLRSSSGGRFNKRLIELEEAGFVVSFKPYGHKKRGIFYRLIDEYTLFYLKWIEPNLDNIRYQEKAKGYWDGLSKSPAWKSWSGLAFEAVCFKHITLIREALSISVMAKIGSWRYSPKHKEDQGAQIDLLFDRDDDVVTLFEIKYTEEPFEIDKQTRINLMKKIEVYRKQTETQKQIFFVLISASGLKQNLYSEELITNVVALKDLFKEN